MKEHFSPMKEYLRDGRSPLPDSKRTSRVMSANKGKDTSPELAMRKALRAVGLPGYRLNYDKVPGRPDITYPGAKVAIFVHGDFWHRCPVCDLPLPKTHTEFWRMKLQRNVERDKERIRTLEESGWKVFVFWEHEIRVDAAHCAEKVKSYLEDH